LLVQPYLPAIVSHGEVSVVVVDGAISHALLKRPASGDYRIQSMYGGVETPFTLSSEHREVVERVLALVPGDPVYARVDLLPVDGEMAVMEVELIEPYLYPEQGPELGERLALAVERRL
jgi:glutathione synthase/RimK-type ligase-like ATP-grasp enzyme